MPASPPDDEKGEVAGIEPASRLSEGSTGQGLAQPTTGHFAQTFARESQSDSDLALILERWPTLPEPIKAAIRALIGSVVGLS
jgi:hypothetical protein